MKKCIAILAVLVMVCTGTIEMKAQQTDCLLDVMRTEMNREFAQLKQQEVKPYYISFRVTDYCHTNIQSNMGHNIVTQTTKGRNFTPQIRVGNKHIDNFKFTTQGSAKGQQRQAQAAALPYADATKENIAAAIWTEMRNRYEFATKVYQETKAKMETEVGDEDKSDCFSDAPAEKYYEAPLQTKSFDMNLWKKRMDEVSAAMSDCRELQQGVASLTYELDRVYFTSTDGTEIVQNRISARVMLTASTVAEDGMQLPVSHDYFAVSVDSLPSAEVMIAKAKELVKRVMALRNAPVANPYTGPAILSGPASGVFFHEIFGHRLESHRLKTGGETFRDMVGDKILPSDFQVYCDPSRQRYQGKALNGYYIYDSEGVKSRRVDNIVNGVLKNFLLSRVPMDGFPQSNGHGRASDGFDAVSRQSNLIVETTKPHTDDELRKMLREEAKKQGKEYGYFFLTVTGGYTTTGQGNSLNVFNVTPVEVFRVYVDGRPDELVRGVDLIGTPLSMFSHIAAAGNQSTIFTGACGAESGWVPVACASPEIYVTQIETQRRQKAKATPPILAAPGQQTGDSNVAKAISDEQQRVLGTIAERGTMKPYYISTILNKKRSFYFLSELGGMTRSDIQPWSRNLMSEVLVGSEKDNNRGNQERYFNTNVTIDDDVEYVKRSVWLTTDNSYKDALNTMAQKRNYYASAPKSPELAAIPDMIMPTPGEYIDRQEFFEIDSVRIANLVKKMSVVFVDYPALFDTNVSIEGCQMELDRVTTNGLHLGQNLQWVRVYAQATAMSDDKMKCQDALSLSYATLADLPSDEELVAKVREFADDLMAQRNAPLMDEEYKGAVMFEESASAFSLIDNLAYPGGLLSKHSVQLDQEDLGRMIGSTVIDKRISIVNVTDKKEYNGKKILGHYDVDVDGNKPMAETVLVDKGKMVLQMNGCRPTLYNQESNGCVRFGNNPNKVFPTESLATLHVRAEKTTPQEKMQASLIKAAKKAGKQYAYTVVMKEGRNLMHLYRIDLKTGERTLVRSNAIAEPRRNNLVNLLAISSDEVVLNSTNECNSTVIAPRAIIVNDFTLSKPVTYATSVPAVSYPLK